MLGAPCAADDEIVPVVSWTAGNELFAFGDDHKVTQWDVSGEVQGKVADLEPFAISVALCPSAGGQGNDVFALACADGAFRSAAGRGGGGSGI